MKFEVGELAVLNEKARNGLPNRVGELVEISSAYRSQNYDYSIELDNGELVPVKEKELNHLSISELDLITYIKRGNKVIYAPKDEVVEIIKVDYLHGQAEVKFYDSAMSIIGFEQLRPIEEKEEEVVKDKFKVGDKVRAVTSDHYNGKTGVVESITEHKADKYRVRHETGAAFFFEEELELLTEEENKKELHFDLLFGHFENEDGTYTVPKQLLHNLLNKIL